MNIITAAVCGGLVIIIAAFVLVWRKRRKGLDPIVVEILTLADVIKFFKREEIASKLKANKDYMAVALKEKGNVGRVRIDLCIFDNKASAVSEPLALYDAAIIDDALANAFGDKGLLVLK